MKLIIWLGISFSLFCGSLDGQSATDNSVASKLAASRSLFSQKDHGADLRAEAIAKNQDVTRQLVVKESPIICNDCAPPNPQDHPAVRLAAVNSDLIILAKDTLNVSELTTNNAFVFTNSQMQVEDVWKMEQNASAGEVVPGSFITLTTGGGAVKVEGHMISVSVSNQLPIKVGHSYLLFLKYIPESSTYMTTSIEGFDISGPAIRPLRTTIKAPLEEYFQSPSAFLNLMRQSVDKAVSGGSL